MRGPELVVLPSAERVCEKPVMVDGLGDGARAIIILGQQPLLQLPCNTNYEITGSGNQKILIVFRKRLPGHSGVGTCPDRRHNLCDARVRDKRNPFQSEV